MTITIRNGLVGAVLGAVVALGAALALPSNASANPAGAAIAHGSQASVDTSIVEKVYRRYYRRYGYRPYAFRPYRYGYGYGYRPYSPYYYRPYGYYGYGYRPYYRPGVSLYFGW
jgi:hypothetical protein